MKRFFAYSIIALLSLCASCMSTESGDVVTKVVLELDNDKIAVSPDGGDFAITVRTNEAWTLTWSEGSEWCVPSVTEGEANMDGVEITFIVGMTYDSREANFWFETSGGMTRNLVVTQKAKAVVLPNDDNEFEIPAEGGIARIEFDATYPCAVVIADDAKGWVEEITDEALESRALESYVIDLNILTNTNYSARETVVKVVVVGSEDVYAEYTIKQAQKNAILPGENNTFDVSADGDIIQIMFETNISWEIVISDEDKEWIVLPEATRALREECVELEILANEGYSARSATLMIVGVEDDTLYAEYTVNQAQRDAVITDENNRYIVAPQGGEIEIAFETNVDYEVVIPEDVDWITLVTEESTRALESKTAMLAIAENDTYKEREAVVRVEKVGDSELYVEYVIVQRQNDALLTDGTILIEVASTGGEEEIAYLTNVACEVVIPEDVDWITLKEATRGLQAESAVLVIAPNDTYDAREAVVNVVMVDNDELSISYTISQAQMNGIILEDDRVEATVDGGIVDLGYSANVDCDVIFAEDCDWVYLAPETRGLEARNLSLIIEANDTFESRETIVILSGEGIDREITITQEAKRFDVVVMEYNVSTEATTIEVVVDANVNYEVVIAEECDWLSISDVEGNPSHNLLMLDVAENDTIYERSAEVVLKHGEREFVVVVKQGADEGLLNVDEEFVVDGGETEVVVTLESNFAYKVIIPEECDWVEMPVTRRAKVQSSTVRFMVHRNPSVLDRYVDIEFADAKNTISKTIRITQRGNDLLEVFDVADNEILYVTTDGSKLVPNNSGFGSFMVEHVYENGYGRIAFLDAVSQLGDGVFENCTTLKQIAIPGCVESIGSNAFKGCSALEDVVIPQSVKSIGVGAFRGNNIAEVTFADGSLLESIADEAFYGCKNLKSVVIPEGVKNLGKSAFSNCSALESITLAESVETLGVNIFGGCHKLESVTLPESVKFVPECAFLNCVNLKQVVLGEVVEEIGMSAFSGCTSLQNIIFPDSLKVIDNSAFYNCRSITEVGFGEASQLTAIGNNAFKDCVAVESVVIPVGVESVGTSAFSGCAGTLEVNVDIADATATSGAYHGSLFDNVVIGDNVTTIGNYAFYGHSTIKSVTFGNGVESIGEKAFGGCDAIEVVALPEGVKHIGNGAFNGCTAVQSVVLPASVETIGESAFVGCAGELLLNANVADGASSTTGIFCGAKFSRVVVGDAVTSIGNYAFAKCADIAELNLGNSLEYIGDSAFAGCNALEVVDMPASVATIGEGIFANCENLNRVVLSEGVATISDSAFSGCTLLAEVVVADSVVTIGNEAFKGCANLAGFALPASVESIGDSAFYGCSAIEDVTMPSAVVAVGKSAFESCVSLASVTLSEGLTSISERAFAGCSALDNVVIPNGVTAIGASAFEECDALKALIVFDESVLTTIGSKAFSGCDVLAHIDIPTSIVAIEDGAFRGCSNISEVALGEALQLTTIGNEAFNGCTYVKSVVLPASVTTIGTSAFVGCGGDLEMNADIANGTSATKGIFYGTQFSNVVIGEGVTTIGDYAFAGCSTIENATIGSTVTTLGKSAFEGCALLAEANIPAGVATIGDGAYSGCSSLMAVAFGEASQLTAIGNNAFNGCVALAEANIPVGVVTIGDSAYNGCTSIKTVALGEVSQLTAIGESAFNGCTAVESVVLPASVATIGTSAFVGCGGDLEMNADIANGTSATKGIFYGTQFSNVVIGEGVTTIGDYAFAGCSTIENATIGSTVTTLGKSAFEGCALLAEANIPAYVVTIGDSAYSGCTSIKTVALGEALQLTAIGKSAFNGCTAVESVVLPASVATIGTSAFVGCGGDLVMNADIANGTSATKGLFYGTQFSDVVIGEGVTTIGDYAFAGCATIENVAIGANVAIVGKSAFNGCSKLKVVNIPNSVTILGESAFEACTSLVSAIMGTNMERINHKAFNGCSNLNIVYSNAVTPPMLGSEVFVGCPSTFTIYVPKTSVKEYQRTKGWSSYRDRIISAE